MEFTHLSCDVRSMYWKPKTNSNQNGVLFQIGTKNHQIQSEAAYAI